MLRVDGLTIELTRACNLRCSFCYQGTGRRADAIDGIEPVRLRRILDGIEVRDVWLTGGEPILYRRLPSLLAYLADRGVHATLTSNGTLIDRARAELLVSSGLSRLVISLDGPPAVHDRRRGRQGVFDLVEAAVRAVAGRISVRLNTLICPTEPQAALDLLSLVAGWPVESVSLSFLEWSTLDEVYATARDLEACWGWRPTSNDLPVPRSPIRVSPDYDWAEFVERCVTRGAEYGLKVTCSSPFAHPEYSGTWGSGHLNRQALVRCAGSTRGALRLSAHGEFIFCGSLRKHLGREPLRDARDLSARLEANGLTAVCMRCCKLAVVAPLAGGLGVLACS